MHPPLISVVIVLHNMRRAGINSLRALLPDYQRGMSSDDYEILVVDNGSDDPLEDERVEALGSNIHYLRLQDPPPSPAYAINLAVSESRGDVLALMVDGAHMLTPGVLHHGKQMFTALPNPLVVTMPFFLGPGPQFETVLAGYDESEEDRLLASINWPDDGYRLFEIGVPYRIEPGGIRPRQYWFVRQFESNCLFARRSAFDAVGGCDERFDIPGGGIMLPDLYLRLCELPDTEIVQLMGEASFHQVHGGTSTNVSREQQKAKWETYLAQYESLRGKPYRVSQKPLRFYGHMPNDQTRRLMETG
ncbi:MAG: glycosyltransferase [Pseudomonadota bacterium]